PRKLRAILRSRSVNACVPTEPSTGASASEMFPTVRLITPCRLNALAPGDAPGSCSPTNTAGVAAERVVCGLQPSTKCEVKPAAAASAPGPPMLIRKETPYHARVSAACDGAGDSSCTGRNPRLAGVAPAAATTNDDGCSTKPGTRLPARLALLTWSNAIPSSTI